MIIKIDTKTDTNTSNQKGIPVVVDDETIGYIKDASKLWKKVLQAMFEEMDDLRKEVEEKRDLIEQLSEEEQEQDDWTEIEQEKADWFGDHE